MTVSMNPSAGNPCHDANSNEVRARRSILHPHRQGLRLGALRIAPLTGVGVWLMLACVVMLGAFLTGCGDSHQETEATSSALTRQIISLRQGVSVDFVKQRLGEPDAERSDGDSESLSYGIWQLSFVENRLETRSKVIAPKNGQLVLQSPKVTKKVLQLKIGTKLKDVEAKLGAPETVSVIYEGQSRPIRILSYASWELTFVHGALSQRAQ